MNGYWRKRKRIKRTPKNKWSRKFFPYIKCSCTSRIASDDILMSFIFESARLSKVSKWHQSSTFWMHMSKMFIRLVNQNVPFSWLLLFSFEWQLMQHHIFRRTDDSAMSINKRPRMDCMFSFRFGIWRGK